MLERLSNVGIEGLLITEPANLRYLLDDPNVRWGAYLLCADRRIAIIHADECMPASCACGAESREPTDLLSALRALDYFSGVVGYDDTHLSPSDVAALQGLVGERVTLQAAPDIFQACRQGVS